MSRLPTVRVYKSLIVIWIILGTATVYELLFIDDLEWLSVATAWLGGVVTEKLLEIHRDIRDAQE